MHCHASGGKLNTHLDYSIHPKLNLQRKINIIIYLNKDWDPSWGGSLGLWSHNPETRQPNELINKIECVFNRAVIFDTTMNSWHGLPDAISCPDNRSRNSLAVYYLCEPEMNADERQKVLFAPTEEQKGDSFIEDLIVKRASSKNASSVYKI
jgi:Rps23 Pro-64 3,4-dihydroxylase Tpa1-like proline 4-hydroxylase